MVRAEDSDSSLSKHQIRVGWICTITIRSTNVLLASTAMQNMNGVILGSKQIVVRLHEPKQLRQEKLAHRFGNASGSSHPRNRSGSGATSPTPSEGDSAYWGRSSPGGPVPSATHMERPRRSSGSYYTVSSLHIVLIE